MDSTLATRNQLEIRGGTLRVLGGEAAGKTLEVGPDARLVGRSAECHLAIPDKRVSSVHFEVVATDQGVRVRDMGSRNGTLLHGHRITEAYLLEEARLGCGDTELVFAPAEPELQTLPRTRSFGPLVGGSPRMRALFACLEKLAPTELKVLITGETGTGKEVVAHAIHEASPRARKPFVVIDCGAIPPSLAESMLFGHE